MDGGSRVDVQVEAEVTEATEAMVAMVATEAMEVVSLEEVVEVEHCRGAVVALRVDHDLDGERFEGLCKGQRQDRQGLRQATSSR